MGSSSFVMATTTSQKPPGGGGVAMATAPGQTDTTVGPTDNGGGVNPIFTTRSTAATTGAKLPPGGVVATPGGSTGVPVVTTSSVAPPAGRPLNGAPTSGNEVPIGGPPGTTAAAAPEGSGGINLGLVVGIPVAIGVLIILGLIIFFVCWKKKRSKKSDIQKIEKKERNGRVPINGILRDKKISHILIRQPSREGAELYVVRHFHQAEDPNQLTLHTGRFVEVIDKLPNGWWRGIIDDREGWFPAEFVKKIDVAHSLSADNDGEIEDIANANTPNGKTGNRNSVSYEEWIKNRESQTVNGQQDDTENIQGYLNEIFSIEDETNDSKRNSVEEKKGLFESKIAKEKPQKLTSDSDMTDQEQVMDFGSENEVTPCAIRKNSQDSGESDRSDTDSGQVLSAGGSTKAPGHQGAPSPGRGLEMSSRQDETQVLPPRGTISLEQAGQCVDKIQDNKLKPIEIVGKIEVGDTSSPAGDNNSRNVADINSEKTKSVELRGRESLVIEVGKPQMVLSNNRNRTASSSLSDGEKHMTNTNRSFLGDERLVPNSVNQSGIPRQRNDSHQSDIHKVGHVTNTSQSDVPSELTHSDMLSSQDDTFDSDGDDDSRAEVAKFNLPADTLQIGHGAKRHTKTYVAMYPFTPSSEDQIGLSPTDVLYSEDGIDTNGWIRGRKRDSGEQGWFPKSYVREGKSPMPNRKSVSTQDEPGQESEFDEDLTGMEYQALYTYSGQQEGDLTLNPGDLVVVLEMLENGWWRGCSGGKEGWFPGTYVEGIPQTPATPTSQDSGFSSLQAQEPLAVSSPLHTVNSAAPISVSPIPVVSSIPRTEDTQDTSSTSDYISPGSPGNDSQPGASKPQVPRRYVVPKLVKIQQQKLSRLSKKIKRPTRPAPPVPQKSPSEPHKYGVSPKPPAKKHSAPPPPVIPNGVKPKSPGSMHTAPVSAESLDLALPKSATFQNGQVAAISTGIMGPGIPIRKKRHSVERPKIPPPRPPTGPPARRMSEGQVGEIQSPRYNRSLSEGYSKVVPSWENAEGQTDFALVSIQDGDIMGGSLEEEILASLSPENKAHLNWEREEIPETVDSTKCEPGVSLLARPHDIAVGAPSAESSPDSTNIKHQKRYEGGMEGKTERKSFGAHGDTVIPEDSVHGTGLTSDLGTSEGLKDSTKAARRSPSRPEPPVRVTSLYKGSKTPPPARSYTDQDNNHTLIMDNNYQIDLESTDYGSDKRTPPPLPPKPDPKRLRTRRSKSDPNVAVVQSMVKARAKNSSQPKYDIVNGSELQPIQETSDQKVPPNRPKQPPQRAISAGNLPEPRPLSDQLEEFRNSLANTDMSFGESDINEILLSPIWKDSEMDKGEVEPDNQLPVVEPGNQLPEPVNQLPVVEGSTVAMGVKGNYEHEVSIKSPFINDDVEHEDVKTNLEKDNLEPSNRLPFHVDNEDYDQELFSKPISLVPRMAMLPRPVTPPRGMNPVKRAKSPRRRRNQSTSPKPVTTDSGNGSPSTSPPTMPTTSPNFYKPYSNKVTERDSEEIPSNLISGRRSKEIPNKPPRNFNKPATISGDTGPVSSVDPVTTQSAGPSTGPVYITSPISSPGSSTSDLDNSHLRFFTPTKFVAKYSSPRDVNSISFDKEGEWRTKSPPPATSVRRVISPVPALGQDGRFVSRPMKTDFDTPRPFVRSPLGHTSISLSTEEYSGFGYQTDSSTNASVSPARGPLVLTTEDVVPSLSVKKTKFSTSPLQDLSDIELESEV